MGRRSCLIEVLNFGSSICVDVVSAKGEFLGGAIAPGVQVSSDAAAARSAALLQVPMEVEGGREIAKRSRGTPRVANRLLRRVRDFAEIKAEGHIDKTVADAALAMLDVDPLGFDVMDRKLLDAVVHRFDGGPVGLDNVAAAIGEEPGTIEDVIEPYLIQQGYLQRTPRGRIATLATYRHLGVAPPTRGSDLFDG